MSDHRSAASQAEVKFPDREEHKLAFDDLLAGAYSAQMHMRAPVTFVYFGQTSPGQGKGFMPYVCLSSVAEFPAALMKSAQVARNAGNLPDVVIAQMIEDLKEMLDA